MKRGFLKTAKAKDALHKDSPSGRAGGSPPMVAHPIQKPESVLPENTNSIMKRGFLKTDKAKAALHKDHPIQQPESVLPENRNTGENTNRPAQQGLEDPLIPPSTDLHNTPPWFEFLWEKKRAIFRDWPRDPNGKTLSAGLDFRGKQTPNGFLSWGATLYDFYRVRPTPQESRVIAITSGSRIAATIRAAGETEVAAKQLAWADQEADPCEVPVVDPGELIESFERSACTRIYYSAVDEVRTRGTVKHSGNPSNNGNGSEDSPPKNSAMSVLMSDRPLSSPFHPSHYPEPWPFIPFSNSEELALLQKRIPLHLLPETLYVHDPYDLLSVRRGSLDQRSTIPWLAKPPKVYKYKLNLIPSACDTAQKARKEAEAKEMKNKRVLHVYRFPPTEEERARGEPTYDVPLPTKPPALTQVEEAHLYISPTRSLGSGNHSFVYKAEFELPRDLFLEPKMCSTCVFNELQKEVRKLKKSGKWRTMLHAAGYELPPKGDDEGSAVDDYEMTFPPVPYEEFDQEVISVQQHAQSNSESSTPCPETTPHFLRVYCPEVRWQNPQTPCEHMPDRHLRPRTAMFQVAAKLSIQYDEHLVREAQNYQSFPDHFFQHWNGYNIVRPLTNPVPVHALVPQFYGYYVPEDVAPVDVPLGSEIPRPVYLSPILLLEHCGYPVVPSILSKDEREECVSLFLRFNHAGWLHDSIAERNFLCQVGPPTIPPPERRINGPSSFRLIDFGRSRFVEERRGGEFQFAQDDAIRLFNVSLVWYGPGPD